MQVRRSTAPCTSSSECCAQCSLDQSGGACHFPVAARGHKACAHCSANLLLLAVLAYLHACSRLSKGSLSQAKGLLDIKQAALLIMPILGRLGRLDRSRSVGAHGPPQQAPQPIVRQRASHDRVHNARLPSPTACPARTRCNHSLKCHKLHRRAEAPRAAAEPSERREALIST
jgi:hypothetical protein